MSCTVRFEPTGATIEAEAGRSLLDVARDAGVPMAAVCGGRGTCGKCRVRVLSGPAPDGTAKEKATLSEAELARGWRLACEYVVTGSAIVQSIAVHSLPKAEALPIEPSFAADPPVRRLAAEVPIPGLDPPSDDAGSLCAALSRAGGESIGCGDLELLGRIPGLLRAAGWSVEASLRQGELIGLRPSRGARPPLGLAVDLGTTNLAGFLYRLDSGELLGTSGAANPLSSYGADIVSRLAYAERSPGHSKELREILVKAVNLLAERAAGERGFAPGDIEEMVAVGNSGMHHLFLGLPGRQLIRAPYVPALRAALSVKAREFGLAIAEGAYLHMPPLVGGFIGSDLLAVALSSRMDRATGIRLAVDIGTNTEALLSVEGELSCCSTASGPALEGAALRFGTAAAPDAIDRVWVNQQSGGLEFSTLGNRPAAGICGSGIIDALRALRELGALSRRGRLLSDFPGVLPDPGGDHRYTLAPRERTSLGSGLTVSQMEIRSVLLAKGAIRAGIDTLLAVQGVEAGSIDEFLVAGAFGDNLDIESAMDIGLFPRLPRERFRQIGNAAGAGASLMLLSMGERAAAGKLAPSIAHIELSRDEGFRRHFAAAQWFPEEGE